MSLMSALTDSYMEEMRSRTTREWLAMPAWVKSELLSYVEHGDIEDGTTLWWALSNDWKYTISYAGDDIWPVMRELMIVIVNYIPADSQGSPERVKEWVSKGGLRGRQ